jgi:hypothetical protein
MVSETRVVIIAQAELPVKIKPNRKGRFLNKKSPFSLLRQWWPTQPKGVAISA